MSTSRRRNWVLPLAVLGLWLALPVCAALAQPQAAAKAGAGESSATVGRSYDALDRPVEETQQVRPATAPSGSVRGEAAGRQQVKGDAPQAGTPTTPDRSKGTGKTLKWNKSLIEFPPVPNQSKIVPDVKVTAEPQGSASATLRVADRNAMTNFDRGLRRAGEVTGRQLQDTRSEAGRHIEAAFTVTSDTAREAASQAMRTLRQGADNARDGVRRAATQADNVLSRVEQEARDAVALSASRAREGAREAAGMLSDGIRDAADSTQHEVNRAIARVEDGVREGASALRRDIERTESEVLDDVSETAGQLQTGVNLAALTFGLAVGEGRATDFVRDLSNNLISAVHDTRENIGRAIRESSHHAQAAVDETENNLLNETRRAREDAAMRIERIEDEAQHEVERGLEDVLNEVDRVEDDVNRQMEREAGHLRHQLRETAEDALEGIDRTERDVGDSIEDGINNFQNGLRRTQEDLKARIGNAIGSGIYLSGEFVIGAIKAATLALSGDKEKLVSVPAAGSTEPAPKGSEYALPSASPVIVAAPHTETDKDAMAAGDAEREAYAEPRTQDRGQSISSFPDVSGSPHGPQSVGIAIPYPNLRRSLGAGESQGSRIPDGKTPEEAEAVTGGKGTPQDATGKNTGGEQEGGEDVATGSGAGTAANAATASSSGMEWAQAMAAAITGDPNTGINEDVATSGGAGTAATAQAAASSQGYGKTPAEAARQAAASRASASAAATAAAAQGNLLSENIKSFGVPRIGQEVTVDFLEGDPDQPIITGRVYNAEGMPPYELSTGEEDSVAFSGGALSDQTITEAAAKTASSVAAAGRTSGGGGTSGALGNPCSVQVSVAKSVDNPCGSATGGVAQRIASVPKGTDSATIDIGAAYAAQTGAAAAAAAQAAAAASAAARKDAAGSTAPATQARATAAGETERSDILPSGPSYLETVKRAQDRYRAEQNRQAIIDNARELAWGNAIAEGKSEAEAEAAADRAAAEVASEAARRAAARSGASAAEAQATAAAAARAAAEAVRAGSPTPTTYNYDPTSQRFIIEGPTGVVVVDDLEALLKDALNAGWAIQSGVRDPYYLSRGSWGQDYDDEWAIKRVGFTNDDNSAWNLLDSKAKPVVVAVIDSGLAWNHEDLSLENLWINENEIPENGKDDDRNGYIDDVVGWNFVQKNNLPWDFGGHGTLLAGVIAGSQNNGIGIAGINPHAKIMVLKVVDDRGRTNAGLVAKAILYAAYNGARVINLSVGGRDLTLAGKLAIDYAHHKGTVIVVAAGNNGINVKDFGPAALNKVITVAATDPNDKRLGYSNWGQGIDIAAPGVDVLSLRARGTDLMRDVPGMKYKPGENYVGKDKKYYRASGTSVAAPIVAGTASLMLSKYPHLTNKQVKRMLLHSAEDIEIPGFDQYTGYGLLDARAALSADPKFFVDALITSVKVVKTGKRPFVRVIGTADADQLKKAWVEIGAGEKPTEWKKVSWALSSSVRGAKLADIPTYLFAGSNRWTIRVITEHQNGRRREARSRLSFGSVTSRKDQPRLKRAAVAQP